MSGEYMSPPKKIKTEGIVMNLSTGSFSNHSPSLESSPIVSGNSNLGAASNSMLDDRCIHKELEMFFLSPNLSDVTLVVETIEFPAHRMMLAAQSSVFFAMFNSENVSQNHSSELRVVIEGINATVMKEILKFIYTNSVISFSDREIALNALSFCERYKIMSLKPICEGTLYRSLTIHNALETLEEATKYNAAKLRKKTICFMGMHRKEIAKTEHFNVFYVQKPELLFEFFIYVIDHY